MRSSLGTLGIVSRPAGCRARQVTGQTQGMTVPAFLFLTSVRCHCVFLGKGAEPQPFRRAAGGQCASLLVPEKGRRP